MSRGFSSLDLIPTFHAVMRTGSLSGAARALRLAQPTVRRHIEALEAELGTTLFTRAANGLTPTDIAQRLLPSAQSVLDEAAALRRAASAQHDSLAGVVRLTCSRVVAVHVLPLVLPRIRALAPDLRFEVAATDSTENLARRAADIGIRFVRPVQQALVIRRLPPVEIGFFGAAGGVHPACVEDLRRHPFISDDRDDLILPALAAVGMPVPENIVLRCDDPMVQIAHLQTGLGIGACQARLAARLGLVRVLAQFRHDMPVWLVVHEDQARIARIRLVLDQLAALLPDLM